MITQRAVLVGIVGFCLYLIALVNSLPSYFYVLTWLAVSILVSSGGIALLSLLGLECRWRVAQKTGAESLSTSFDGEDFVEATASETANGPSLEIELINTGTLNKMDTLLDVRLQHAARGTQTTRRFLVEALPSGTALCSTLVLRGLPRGRYKILSLRVTGSDVLGLFRARRMAAMPGDEGKVRPFWDVLFQRRNSADDRRTIEVLVGPATVDSGGRGSEGHSVAAGEEAASSDLLGRSDEIRGTRPYVAGDDLRNVHWKSTARLGRLVVREFDRLARPQCVVLWDGTVNWGDEAALFETFGGASPVEFGLRLAASLCEALIAQNRPCALLRLDSRPTLVAVERSNTRTQFVRCLEALAGADAGRENSLSVALSSWTKELENASEIFIVSASARDQLEAAILTLRRLGLRVSLAACDVTQWPRAKARRKNAAGFRLNASSPRKAFVSDPESLSGLGARVVTLSPTGGDFWQDSTPALRSALVNLLGTLRTRQLSQGGVSHQPAASPLSL